MKTMRNFLKIKWPANKPVVSRKDIDELYVKHVLHSLGIAKVVQFKDKTKNKPIYGHATKEDVKELNEEGIEVATIPWINKKEN